MSPNADKLPLSVALIAHNEAHNLPRCLDSVATLAGEIVVVINDCTDATAEIAQSYGATVHEESWHGHRDQKNIALSKVTQPWVLCLDADEVLSPALQEAVQTFIEADDPRFNGAAFRRKVWFLGRWITHGDWYPDWSLRLIRNGQGRWAGSREHDQMQLQGAHQRLYADLHHFSNPTLNRQIEKMAYFGDIFLQRELDKGRRFSLWKATMRPPWRFIRAYLLRRGFMDGFPGLYIAVATAFATFVRHSRLYEYAHDPATRERFRPQPDRQDLQ
ncbi:MAG: glycosyltransferase family 2 protein [Opitutales bacterium]